MSHTPTAGFHHVAYACSDLDETNRFYTELMGFTLVHTEVSAMGDGFFRHVFYDAGDGANIAFFDLHDAGEEPGWSSAISTGLGLPLWVNHVAFRADEAQQEAVRERMDAAGIKPVMELDHGWCQSLYYRDPNGIMVELCRDTPGFVPDPNGARAALHDEPEKASAPLP